MKMHMGVIKRRLGKIGLAGSLSLVLAAGVLPCMPVEAAKQMPISTSVDEKSLELPVDTFVKRLNSRLKTAQVGFTAGKPEISEGAVNDVLKLPVGPHNVVIATLGKGSRVIKQVMIVGSGDGTPKSGMTILMAVSAVFAATTPDLQVKDVLPNLPDILKGEDQQHGSVSFSGVKTPTMGAVFTAQAI